MARDTLRWHDCPLGHGKKSDLCKPRIESRHLPTVREGRLGWHRDLPGLTLLAQVEEICTTKGPRPLTIPYTTMTSPAPERSRCCLTGQVGATTRPRA